MSSEPKRCKGTYNNYDVLVEYENGFFFYSVLAPNSNEEVIGGWLSKEEAPDKTAKDVFNDLTQEIDNIGKGE